MKVVITLSVLFLWTAIVAPISCMSSSNCEAVVDIEGEYLQPKVPYYITPVIGSGGLGIAAGDNKAVQLVRAAEGIPVTFRPANESDGVVCLSADTEVAFSDMDTAAWTLASDGVLVTSDGLVDEAGETSGLNLFMVKNFHKHNPHDHHHHKYRHHHNHQHKHPNLPRYPIIDNYYKLAFCPSTIVGGFYSNKCGDSDKCADGDKCGDSYKCGDLGIFAEEDDKRRLGLNGSTPFPMVFKRA